MTIAAAPATAAAAAEVGAAANENAVMPSRRDPATEALSVCTKIPYVYLVYLNLNPTTAPVAIEKSAIVKKIISRKLL